MSNSETVAKPQVRAVCSRVEGGGAEMDELEPMLLKSGILNTEEQQLAELHAGEARVTATTVTTA